MCSCRPEVADIFLAGDHQKMAVTSGRHEYKYDPTTGNIAERLSACLASNSQVWPEAGKTSNSLGKQAIPPPKTEETRV